MIIIRRLGCAANKFSKYENMTFQIETTAIPEHTEVVANEELDPLSQ